MSAVISMLFEVLAHALMITGFVFVMMLVIEYINVATQGKWERMIERWKWGQSILSSFLGATPGCLGAFAVGSLYIHRVLTLGALVAAMIATCGDEAFVMLALFPGKALALFGILFVVGVVSGIVTDVLLKARKAPRSEHVDRYRAGHPDVAECINFSRTKILGQWRRCSPHRGWLTVFLVLFVIGILSGVVGHHHLGVDSGRAEHEHLAMHAEHEAEAEAAAEHGHGDWSWVRVTLLAVGLMGLAIVVTVPDHFLDEHLWNHIARVHIWRIFVWTVGALVVTHILVDHIDVEGIIAVHYLPVLLLACLVGIIPESGPHLVFVTLFAEGAIPFSVLLASCIVQDGHGMIPVLAHSRTAFLTVKGLNFAVGLAVGLIGFLMGW